MKKKKDMKKPLLAAVLACSMVQIPAIPVAAAAPENLALNQTVTASSYEQPTNNPEKTSPSKAVDGDLTTRWGTAQNLAANEWINVNLGSSKQIQQININFERTDDAQNILGYKVEIANGNDTYTEIYRKEEKAKQKEVIKLTSPGPIIFCQERVGLHNRPFKMYKFRSMTVQDPGKEKSRWTTKGDARVTLIGKIIRRTSIDEVPQFFNILIGDMSLVGPRPERPFFVEKFKEEIPRYMIKHQVRPGLTGWAQVNGYRGDTSIIKRIEHDLYYIENWTLGLDFKIMFLTVFKGFINKNAY